MRKFCGFILKIFGWKFVGEVPALNKFVICVAPHTSNIDFIIGKLMYASLGLKLSFLIKKEWLNPPLGKFMRRHGAIGIDRSRSNRMTDILAELFKKKKQLHLAITPEGTRKASPVWKRGFYYIAYKAEVPILIVGFDYKYKEIKVLDLFYPTGNEEADIRTIKSYYKGITALYPSRFVLGEGFENN